jgi:hypothetical protein
LDKIKGLPWDTKPDKREAPVALQGESEPVISLAQPVTVEPVVPKAF